MERRSLKSSRCGGSITSTPGPMRMWCALLGAAFTLESKLLERNYLNGNRTDECTICTHDIDASQRMVALCGHTFHRCCVMVWMRTYGYCPDCRPSRV
ncbi:uncharacterized protein LOC126572374 [Anopheles aquasalis]|uniref:uncharacterized protein LOC126572374 n=1 Tax=Anopheles aquasalis TaxID=42839 RepID=UPI00215AE178|nr:uncharacterized protein LOC126572374 [Anopheles aquasalis]